MVKTIYLLLVLSLISFSCATPVSLMAKSKYPQYTLSQGKLLVEIGKCTLVKGNLIEYDIAQGRGGSRTYETDDLIELYSAIDAYIELDKANAFILVQPIPIIGEFGFTTMTCSE
jgi:hypothetical protein